ncbi:MAG: hypothetical protein IPJ40_04225 [Saprospirales bacterium]|nr:hypothetical protein [Saprospirales bacterium]
MASLASPMTASWQRDLDIPLRAAMCLSSHTTIRRDIPSQPLSVEGISYKIFSAIDQALGAWNSVEPTDNCFLGADYLRAVEQAPSGRRYTLLYRLF